TLEVPVEEAEASLLLAIFAVESLHGETQTRLDSAHYFDTDKRACVIDAATAVGRDLARLFTGFLRREFGEHSFQVEHITAEAVPACQPAVPSASEVGH
ncbi:MAG: hypothetical protein ACRELF_05430, partial [Gemmataceae bacterium]